MDKKDHCSKEETAFLPGKQIFLHDSGKYYDRQQWPVGSQGRQITNSMQRWKRGRGRIILLNPAFIITTLKIH